MKIAIIALCLALVALGFSVFATVADLTDEVPTVSPLITEENQAAWDVLLSRWSEAECEDAKARLADDMEWIRGGGEGFDIQARSAWRLAIIENCP